MPDINGLNVTIPHKENVMKFLDEVDDEAKKLDQLMLLNFKMVGLRDIIQII